MSAIRKIEGAKGTADNGGCYLRQDGQEMPLLIRWHLNTDLQEVMEWGGLRGYLGK